MSSKSILSIYCKCQIFRCLKYFIFFTVFEASIIILSPKVQRQHHLATVSPRADVTSLFLSNRKFVPLLVVQVRFAGVSLHRKSTVQLWGSAFRPTRFERRPSCRAGSLDSVRAPVKRNPQMTPSFQWKTLECNGESKRRRGTWSYDLLWPTK